MKLQEWLQELVTLLLVTALVILKRERPRLLSMPVIVKEKTEVVSPSAQKTQFKGDKFGVLLVAEQPKGDKYFLLM